VDWALSIAIVPAGQAGVGPMQIAVYRAKTHRACCELGSLGWLMIVGMVRLQK
jgi:hypothetical protein